MAFWRTKAAISPKRVKIEEKLLWTAYRNSLPQNWGFVTKLPPLISGTRKATDFKFGGYIYRANPS